VLQEAFAAAYNALRADARDINLRPWLYRIARNRSLNHLRRRTAIGVDSMDVHFADMGLSTSDKVFRREDFNQLVGDIQHLPESQRTALLLREVEGLSYEQIAGVMDTTIPGIKSLLVRARIGLAEASEARKLTCDEIRVALAEEAEGIGSLTQPMRRHVKSCERCGRFRKHLRSNDRALAALAPFAPLLLLKQLFATKLGAGGASGRQHCGGDRWNDRCRRRRRGRHDGGHHGQSAHDGGSGRAADGRHLSGGQQLARREGARRASRPDRYRASHDDQRRLPESGSSAARASSIASPRKRLRSAAPSRASLRQPVRRLPPRARRSRRRPCSRELRRAPAVRRRLTP
jgi:RNA polymerase sigma factor (sigma-70 family)